MRDRAVWWATVLLIGFVGLAPCLGQEPKNILVNGGFEAGTDSWNIWGAGDVTATYEAVTNCVGAVVPEKPIEGKYCLHVVVSGATPNFWDAGMNQDIPDLQKGKKYTLSIWLKGKAGPVMINLKPEHAADPDWAGYADKIITMTDTWTEYSITTEVLTADVSPMSMTFHLGFGKGDFWMDAVRWYEGDYAAPAFTKPWAASNPSPGIDATDVLRDVALTWKEGPFADTHNIFLGTSFEDVNNATAANPLSTVASIGQKEISFDPPGKLDYGTTYHWRVDEVNAPPDTASFKGKIWNFTTETYAYPVTGVTVTASSANTAKAMTAVKTIDGSGLDPVSGQHSNVGADGWLTASKIPLPAWIRFDFAQACVVQEMHVWNSNQSMESEIGYGAQTVLIDYSPDGTTWNTLKTEEFPKAEGMSTYTGFTVDIGGVMAKSIRLTIQSNWTEYPTITQTGLAEVRFYSVPVVARAPTPAQYAEGVAVDAAFDWREGRQAASHEVYFGKDKAAVADNTALAGTTTDSVFQPASLEFGQTYFWKVDEVNNAASTPVWPGDVWSFMTTEWADIDDFESYTNESPNRVFQTWIDGYGFSKDDFFPNANAGNGTGAMVGYDPAAGTIMETDIYNSGAQCMPVEYNNVISPYYSEIERTWETPVSWTGNGATSVSLWFHGSPAAFVETASGVTLSGGGADIYQGTAEFRFAYKKLTGDGSVTVRLDSAQTLSDWTKCGVMIRESLDPLGMQVHMISAARQNLVEWMYRSISGTTNTTAFNTNAGTNPLPVWVRLTRAANVFTGECSADGKTWTKITSADGTASSTTISMPTTVYMGMIVCAQSTDGVAVANFSQIKTTGNVTSAWQTADVGVAQPANTADQLYVVVQDSAGHVKVINHPDLQAVCANEWKQWVIPLKDFTGVNMGSVKKMFIGVGNRSQPKSGGAGLLFFDDIQYGRPITPIGLVAHYKLEGDLVDSSGNGHNGVLAGNAAYPVAYVNGPTGQGKAMLFEGTQGHQYVDIGTFNPSALTGKLSVALWAKWDGLSTAWQGLIGKRTNTWARTGMMWQIEANQTDGSVRFQREGISDVMLLNPAPATGQWVHIAVTFDGTNARGYINGVRTVQAAFSFGTGREAPIQFGADTLGGGNSYNGTLDDIRIYDTVLTDAEIAALAGK